MVRRLLGEEAGAVQLYAILLLLPIFVFHAVLIDFIRVKAAEHDAENDVKASARSVLAGFDSTLRPFGLFGLSADSELRKTTFAAVMAGQSVLPGPDHFSFLDVTADPASFQLQTLNSLANPAIFSHQVQVEMRYRAPIEYALEVADKWKEAGIEQKLRGQTAYTEAAKELEELRQKREKAMDEAWRAAQTFAESGKLAYDWANEQLATLHMLADDIGFTDLDTIRSSLSSVSDRMSESQGELQALQQSLTENQSLLEKVRNTAQHVQALEEQIQGIQSDIQNVESSLSDLEQQQEDLTSRLNKALTYIAKVAATKVEMERFQQQLVQALVPVTEKLEEARRDNDQLKEAIERQKAALEQTEPGSMATLSAIEMSIYSVQEWDKYVTDTGSIAALWNGFRLQWGNALWFVGDTYGSLSSGLQAFETKLEQFIHDRSEKERQRTASNLAEANNRKDQLEQTRRTLQLIQTRLTGCSSSGDGSSFQTKYDRLKVLFNKYFAYGSKISPGKEEVSAIGNEETIGKSALALAGKLGGLLTNARNEFFTDEYVLTYYGYRTKANNAAGDGSGSIKGQEVEYALYGYSSCTANEAAAYGEMYLLLLAIRSSEELLSPGAGLASAGTPLLALLTSVANGAAEAALDMNKLTAGESVALVRKLPNLTISYRDLLRLFLIMHSNDVGMTARLQALIELNTAIDLTNAYTYVQATAESTIRLWFPGIVDKGLYWIGLTRCEPNHALCRMTSTAVAAYD